ncbi:hypothetical protein I4U23_006830 [Adineta vaga]|nr:hypothetical protein I4U23_006830 [Adineta vaga]
MSYNFSTSEDNNGVFGFDPPLSKTIKFWLLLIGVTSATPFCSGPWYYYDIPAWLIWYESLFHYVIPIFVLTIFSNTLFLRIYLQKNRLRAAQGWRQYRKMTIQLVFVTITYLFDLPYIIVTIVRWSGFPDFGTNLQGPYFYYVNYIPIVLFPFALLSSNSKVLKGVFTQTKRRRRQVGATLLNRTVWN